MIRLYIETESPVVRAGLEAVFQGQREIELVDLASEADVILNDAMPDLQELGVTAPVVVLSDAGSMQEALRSGVRAILPRNSEASQIIAAVHAASAGFVVIPADEMATLLPPAMSHEIAEPLTPRELEVLEMLAEGVSNKVIAYNLGISEHTAKFHVNSVLAKLSAGTRTEAVTRGIRLGLIKV